LSTAQAALYYYCYLKIEVIEDKNKTPFLTPGRVGFGQACAPWRVKFASFFRVFARMTAASTTGQSVGKPTAFEIKSANLPLVALLLKTTDMGLLAREWDAQYSSTPGFFDQDPLVVDLHALGEDAGAVDFKQLLALLRAHAVCPIAVKGGNPAHMKAALKAGLVAAPDVVLQRQVATPVVETAPAPPPAPVAAPQPSPEAMVIDRPLRSGQQVYARGRDLVVLAMVNPGAEVIADGHVHVYAPLRGKAMAGARGNGDARIFALSMEPELISIAGIYRTSDVPLPADIAGKPAMVRLASGPDGDKLLLEAMRA
jgi:septum site-determining protein MinC